MLPQYKIVILEDARTDIDNAYDNIIREYADYFGADNWHDRIMRKIGGLEFLPYTHPMAYAKAWRDNQFYRLRYKHHVIFFKIIEEEWTVVVARVMLARRDFTKIAPPEV